MSLRLLFTALLAAFASGCILDAGPLKGGGPGGAEGGASNSGGAAQGGAGAGGTTGGAAGTSASAGTAGSTGGSGTTSTTTTTTTGCTKDSDCSVGQDACLVPTCQGGICTPVPLADGKKCADPASACFDISTCKAGICTPSPKPSGTLVDDPKGNCVDVVCDASGQPVPEPNPLDKPDAKDDCHVGSCNGAQPVQLELPNDTSCKTLDFFPGKCLGGGCCPNQLLCGDVCCLIGFTCCNANANFCSPICP